MKQGFDPIIHKALGRKGKKLIYDSKAELNMKSLPVAKKDQERFALTDKEVILLAKWAVQIEEHYKKPMDMEWAQDGRTGKMYNCPFTG